VRRFKYKNHPFLSQDKWVVYFSGAISVIRCIPAVKNFGYRHVFLKKLGDAASTGARVFRVL
jgi:hypothetical protein